jgi:hypothetical protein
MPSDPALPADVAVQKKPPGFYARPSRSSVVVDGRKAQARVLKAAIARLTKAVGGNPSPLQADWIEQAGLLWVQMHALSRATQDGEPVSSDRARAYAALDASYTRLVDKIVAGAVQRKHERVERSEPPQTIAALLDATDG